MSYRKHLMTSDEPPSELYKAVELGANLAEVGTDCISRQAAIEALTEYGNGRAVFISVGEAIIRIEQLPPAQPERIIHCKDCKYGILDSGFPHQRFCSFKGNEWNNDNHYCGHAKRREVTT